MADWTDIDPNTLLPGEPWTSAKAQAAFENVEALAEGADGAPRIAAIALGGNSLGGVAPGPGIFDGWINLDDVRTIHVEASGGINNALTRSIEVRFSDNNGSSWGSGQTVLTYTAGDNTGMSASVAIDLVSGAFSGVAGGFAFGVANSGTLTVPADCNGVQLRTSGVNNPLAFFATITGGKG
jgi:hypothetical protein